MVDLPKVSEGIVTSTAPESAVSRGDIIGQADMMASALNKVADATETIAIKQAKEQAGTDIQNQKVTRNADGSVSVANPANSLIFGRAGEAYQQAVQAGTIAQHSNIISQEMNDIHQKYPTDPALFNKAADSWKAQYLQDHGGGEMGAAIAERTDQLQTQHSNAITNVTGNLSIANQQKSITASIEDQKNTLLGLARQPGGTETPEFKRAAAQMEASYQTLTTNPLFKMPQDQVDLEVKQFRQVLQGEALVAHIDETFTKKDKAEAQKQLTEGILTNPNLPEADRSRLFNRGMARLAYLSADAKERLDAGHVVVGNLETNIANGTIKTTDPIIGMEIKQAQDRGDAEGVNRINAAVATRMHLNGIQSLPEQLQADVLGVTRTGTVNTAIPAEGRSLLDFIAARESGGRYDVRYSGARFPGYADHPRIAEPITSGPDVGKTSSAAGRYQFIGSTWDQQAQKLGLKDFSPANQDAAAWDLAQTEYRTKTGKDLMTVLRSGDQAAIADVPRQLSAQWASLPGGRQPAGEIRAMAPSANGGPGFTAADLQRNPFLGSAYIRTLAADEPMRIQAATQTAAAVTKAIDNGLLPRPQDVALVEQAAAQYPEKLAGIAETMRGKLLGGVIASMPEPQRQEVLAQYRDASNGQDQHHINVAAAAFDQNAKSQKNLAEQPYQEAASRGWIKPVSPVDPSQPGTIAGALAERAAASQRIAELNHSPAPPVLTQSEIPQLQAALEGPQGAAVLASMATSLRPEEMEKLLQQKEIAGSLTAMQSSLDPLKMSTANAAVQRMWQSNPAIAEQMLKKPSIDKMQAWQSLKGVYSDVELAKRLNLFDEPSVAKARDDARAAADKELKGLNATDMAYKMGTGSWLLGRITGNTPNAALDIPDTPNLAGGSLAAGALFNDYKATYTQLRSMGVDASKASDQAVARLKSTWGPSQAAGNQLMKLPPENYNKPIEGAPNWIGQQLNDFVAASEGAQRHAHPEHPGRQGEMRQNWTVAGLVADARTEGEVSNGQKPSYQVAIKRTSGVIDVLPDRFTPNDSKYMAEHEQQLRARRTGMQTDVSDPMAPFAIPPSSGRPPNAPTVGGTAEAIVGGVKAGAKAAGRAIKTGAENLGSKLQGGNPEPMTEENIGQVGSRG